MILTNGFGNVWLSQSDINKKWFCQAFKQNNKDQFLQKWDSLLNKSTSGINYRIIKNEFGINNYFKNLPNKLCRILTAFRTRNHKLPVEVGRWQSKPVNERICSLCGPEVCDEFHYIMNCKIFGEQRKKFILPNCTRHPTILKFNELINNTNPTILRNLSNFVEIIMKTDYNLT